MTGRWQVWGGGLAAYAYMEVAWPHAQVTRTKYAALLLCHQRLLSQTVNCLTNLDVFPKPCIAYLLVHSFFNTSRPLQMDIDAARTDKHTSNIPAHHESHF